MTRKGLVWIIRVALFIAGLLLAWVVKGQAERDSTLFNLMSYQEVLPLVFETDLDSVIARRNSEEEIETFVLFPDATGKTRRLKVDIELRGRYRRRHCAVPPLKLNFKKSELREAGLATFDDFDVVTHCLPEPEAAKDLVAREYLIYKLYNEVTANSYRVQMVRMTFRNPETGKEDKVWGFLVEDTAELEARIDAVKIDSMTILPAELHAPSFNTVLVFQSMIGNVDWGLKPVKNLKIFQRGAELLPIPYDFDFSALVNAPYARNSVNSLLRSEPQLKLLDEPEPDRAIRETMALFQDRRERFLDIARGIGVLSRRSLEKALEHIGGFLDSPYRMAIPLPTELPIDEPPDE